MVLSVHSDWLAWEVNSKYYSPLSKWRKGKMASHFTLATEGQILTADYSTCVHSINQNNNCFVLTSVLVKVVVMCM